MLIQEDKASVNRAASRALQVTPQSGKKPKVVATLNDWQYLERSIHRLICGWGRHFADWDDKRDVCKHIWEQSECVRRLRERLVEFPGTTANRDAPVSARLEDLANTVLLAPSHQDAVDGIYHLLTGALVRSYIRYAETAHPVHDAPTVALIQDIVRIKEQQRLWLRDYRRRHAHKISPAYASAIKRALTACGDLQEPLPVADATARPVGVATGFRLPAFPAQPPRSYTNMDLSTVLERDFVTSIESRRLRWSYGYMLEMGLAIDQMKWIWNAADMPWEFQQDVSRHLWDESRHGDSGYSRLRDFGISIEMVGFHPGPEGPRTSQFLESQQNTGSRSHPNGPEGEAPPMSAKDLYDAVFFIGMVAETTHFPVKHEAYADFRDGGDLESAEMVLFDIIDETSHVQYAHHWLPLLAERAGIDSESYKEAGAIQRREWLEKSIARQKRLAAAAPDTDDPAYKLYQQLLRIMREKQPLTNAETCPPRSYKPM